MRQLPLWSIAWMSSGSAVTSTSRAHAWVSARGSQVISTSTLYVSGGRNAVATRTVRCPRHRPRSSMSMPVASETRKPLSPRTDQGVILRREPTRDVEQVGELRAGETRGARGPLDLGASDEHHRVLVDEPVNMGVLVEPSEHVQPSSDGGGLAAALLEGAGEELDLLPGRVQRVDPRLITPTEELPQARLVGLPRPLHSIPGDEGHG